MYLAGRFSLVAASYFRLLGLLAASAAVAQYVGKEACRGCHPAQASLHQLSGHARALALGEDRGDWAFGSGTHAITWVIRTGPGEYVEKGESWFQATGKLGLTPGHSNTAGVKYRVFDPGAQILRCFSCHSTGVPQVNAQGRIEPAEAGVNCEACHGPGQAHVAAGGAKYKIDNPGQYRAAQRVEQCGACHRQPGTATNWADPWNVRHQPVYLVESRCFLKSEEKLNCQTCHDPHAKLQRAGYDEKCASCHPSAKHKAAVKGSCTGCHMPVVKPVPELGFSNHWIGVYAPGQKLRPRR